MKKKKWIVSVLCVLLLIGQPQKSHAIVWVVVKAAIKKVIVAIDLKIQRQQNKVIWLQNAQKTLENAMSKLKLKEIGEWTQKQKEQYGKYFDELKKVKQVILYYQRIKEIAAVQQRLVEQYKRAWELLRRDQHFTSTEIQYMSKVYAGILQETLNNLDQLAMVVNSFRTQMSDAKRLQLITKVGDQVDQHYNNLLQFNRENALLSLQRAKSEKEIEQVKKIYGLED